MFSLGRGSPLVNNHDLALDTSLTLPTGPNGTVTNGLVGTEFASQYRLQPRAGF